MFWITSKRGGDILMAQSDVFGQFMRDLTDVDGIRGSALKVGITPGYMKTIRDGYIPSAEKLQMIANVYRLSDEMTEKLFTLAKAHDPDINPEKMIQSACMVEGFDANDRLELLEHFRQLKERRESKQTAA